MAQIPNQKKIVANGARGRQQTSHQLDVRGSFEVDQIEQTRHVSELARTMQISSLRVAQDPA
jgi:hypothetical protein